MIYLYRHPETSEVREISQSMLGVHRYFGDDGVEWIREFNDVNATIDTKIDPMSKKQFTEKTRTKNYNFGEISDISAELSEKRAKKMGRDEVKEQTMQEYERKCKTPHPERPKKTKWVI